MKNFKIILAISLILVITFAAFYPSLKNDFSGWDDDLYVIDNTAIQWFSFHNIKQIFTSLSLGSYQPLTILTYLFEYKFFKLHPFGYHLTNLILHLLNSLFVFWLIYLLTRRISISWLTAILFGLHPLHVESVAWISERKDVLYAVFFLAATVSYCYYLREQRRNKYYFFSLALFVFSLLSKPMAITLPFVLLLIDYFKNRKVNKEMFIDKIPFFILSFVFGAVAVIAQYSAGAVRSENFSNFFHKITIPSYIIIFYLNKILVPVKLSCLYLYSDLKTIFLYQYFFVFFIMLLAIIILSIKHTKKIVFGSVFFLVAILPVLQFVPIGRTIVADRYVYVASLGIFYIFAEGILWLFTRKIKYSNLLQRLILAALIVMMSILASLTWKRCQVWKDSVSLWSDVLNLYPNVDIAYNNRGDEYLEQGNILQAISDFNKAIEINPSLAEAYNNRGFAYLQEGSLLQAISDFNKAIEINPKYAKAYCNRGNAYLGQGNIQKSVSDYSRAIEIYPNYVDAYCRRGTVYSQQGNLIQAIFDFNKALEISPNLVEAYNNRGIAYSQQGNLIQAIFDFNKTIGINSKYAEAYSNRGVVYYLKKEYALAWEDVHKAEKLGYIVSPEFINVLKKASGRNR